MGLVQERGNGSSRRRFIKTVELVGAASLIYLESRKLGAIAEKNREFGMWRESRLMEAGGAELIGKEQISYQDEDKREIESEIQAYRLPRNVFFVEDRTSIALLSHSRHVEQWSGEQPWYDNNVVVLPAGQNDYGYWKRETKGDYQFRFGWRLDLGVSPKEHESGFQPRLHNVNYYWGSEEVETAGDGEHFEPFFGKLIISDFPPRLVELPQLVYHEPHGYGVSNDVPSIIYSNEGLRSVPVPSPDLIRRNKKLFDSNINIVDMGDTRMVNGMGEPYTTMTEDIVAGYRLWNIIGIDGQTVRLVTRLNRDNNIIAAMKYDERVIEVLKRQQNMSEQGLVMSIETDNVNVEDYNGIKIFHPSVVLNSQPYVNENGLNSTFRGATPDFEFRLESTIQKLGGAEA